MAAFVLLLLLPLVTKGGSTLTVLTFLHLPVYMLHQFEEHDRDRFRIFFNQTVGQGHEALTRLAVFVTNVPGVWLVLLGAIYAASEVHPGWALIAVYLVGVNALVHIAHAVLFRRYNPGLATAVLLFMPLGGYTWALLHQAHAARPLQHVVAAGLAVGIHVAILMYVRARVRAFEQGKRSDGR